MFALSGEKNSQLWGIRLNEDSKERGYCQLGKAVCGITSTGCLFPTIRERFGWQVENGDRTATDSTITTLLAVVIVLAVLFFARTVFIPLALAVLLAFLLAPLSISLRRWKLGRGPSAIGVVLLFFIILG